MEFDNWTYAQLDNRLQYVRISLSNTAAGCPIFHSRWKNDDKEPSRAKKCTRRVYSKSGQSSELGGRPPRRAEERQQVPIVRSRLELLKNARECSRWLAAHSAVTDCDRAVKSVAEPAGWPRLCISNITPDTWLRDQQAGERRFIGPNR